MSNSSSDPIKKPVLSMNRFGIGVLSITQIFFLAIVVIGFNYLSLHYYTRIDLTRSSDYSLSRSTKRYLKSDALSSRTKPIKWIMAYRKISPFYERVRAIAEEYARLSKGKIELEIVDPMRSSDRLQEITAAYGLTMVRDMMIIDARNDQSAVTTENSQKGKTLNPFIKIIAAEDMAVYSTADGKRKISGFQAEDVLTARLVESIEGLPRKMALLADKSRIDESVEFSPSKSLESIFRFQNIEISPIHLSGLADIPPDMAGVLLVAPKYDFTDAEIAVLERYWSQTKAAILVMIQGGEIPPKLKAFLRGNGVTAHNDRVVTRHDNMLVTRARGSFTQGIEFTRDLAGQSSEFGGVSSSLEVREGATDLINRKISAMGLIQIQDGFWGETKFGKGNETFDEKEDYASPLYLAACVTRGAASDDRFAADTSRMVIIANTDFLTPQNRSAENLDFLASSANWLVGRESLAGIGPRSLGIYKLPLLEAQVSFINRVNWFFLPVLWIIIGGFVWSSRRV